MEWTPNARFKGDPVSKVWPAKAFHSMATAVQGWANVSIQNNPKSASWLSLYWKDRLCPVILTVDPIQIRLLVRWKLRLTDIEALDQDMPEFITEYL